LNVCTQEIKNSGAIGYKYISVDEDEAANVVYANYTLLHLGHEQIPKGSAVSIFLENQFFSYQDIYVSAVQPEGLCGP